MTAALHAVQFKPYPVLAWVAADYWDRPDMNMFTCLKVSLSHTHRNHSKARPGKLIVRRSTLVLGNWEEGNKL